ncbi:hypothetical protein [Pseudarthrobacter albicanus]|uniref:hypothetical protein n=1 Tax=Pseudarthrobacter albicanus TaxID=2823873 RepID=UPI001BAC02A3|nr:hypothetical protein [Pseudarthrobacter albicanus]
MNAEEVEKERQDDDTSTGQNLSDSEVGSQGGSIPSSGDGVGIGAGAEPNTFEPEEDPDATDDSGSSSG